MDEFGELAGFVQDSCRVASVGIVIFYEHRDHVGSELVRLIAESVVEALFFVVTSDDDGLFVLFFWDEFFDLFLELFWGGFRKSFSVPSSLNR